MRISWFPLHSENSLPVLSCQSEKGIADILSRAFASPMIIGGGIFKEWWNGSKEQSQRNWHHFKMGQFPHTISYISHTILRVEKKSRTLLTSSLLRLYEKIITFYSSLQILPGITIWCYLIKRHITRWSYYSGIQFLAIVVNFQVFSYR